MDREALVKLKDSLEALLATPTPEAEASFTEQLRATGQVLDAEARVDFVDQVVQVIEHIRYKGQLPPTLSDSLAQSPAFREQLKALLTVQQEELSRINDALRSEIAVREQTEQALREGERKYRNVVERANDGILIAQDGIIKYCNPQLAHLLGLERVDMEEHPFVEFLVPDERVKIRERYERRMRGDVVPERYETVVLHKTGRSINVEVNASVTDYDGRAASLAFVRDMTLHKKAEANLRQALNALQMRVEELSVLNRITQTVVTLTSLQDVLASLVEQITVLFDAYGCGIALTDEQRTTQTVVASYIPGVQGPKVGTRIPLNTDPLGQRVLRTRQAVIIPRVSSKLLGEHNREFVLRHHIQSMISVPLCARGDVIGTFTLLTNQPGREFTREEAQLAETIAGQIAGAVYNAQLFDEMRQAKESAERAQAAAEAANRAKGAFLANMSHELRTPLNAVLGFSELMASDPNLTFGQQENLAAINRSGEHLLMLINDILDFSKIEAGYVELQPANFDLHTLLFELEDMFSLRFVQKGLGMSFEGLNSVPRYVYGDQGKIRQILINLLDNAVKFTPTGQITLRVKGQFPETDAGSLSRSTLCTLLFEVQDTGLGIPLHELDKVFEVFAQTKSGQQAQQGTGLGLPISRNYARLMGGDLVVRSVPNQGSLFKFDVPVDVVSVDIVPGARAMHQGQTLAPGQVAPDGKPYRLLVVEDVDANRDLLLQILAPLGFDVREARHGREAIQIWEEWHPHLIFMDLRMPVMDGYEATHYIKARFSERSKELVEDSSAPSLVSTRIVALTASAFQENRIEAFRSGCDGFVSKPFRRGDIFEALAQHLGVRFVYEESQTAERTLQEGGAATDLKAAMAALPQALRRDINQAALSADIEHLSGLVTQVRLQDPALADVLEALIYEFAYDEITDLLQDEVRT